MRALLVGLRHCEYESSLALGVLKACADARPSAGWEVGLRTFTTAEPPEAVAAALAAESPDLVGLSVYLWNLGPARRVAAALKAALPGVKVVVGGAEPTSRPAEVLASMPAADWAVHGEGEEAFGELLDRAAAGRGPEGLPGFAWREGGGVVVGPARAPLADLDARPSPWAAGVLPHSAYPAVCFEASRGCPFDCKYCDWQNKSRVRRHSEERAASDMARLLAALPEARVFVCDSDLFLEPRRGERLARAWADAARGLRCSFEVHAYLPRLDDAVLRALDAPQFTVCVGVQTANPRALERVSRFFDAERTRERAAAFRRLAPRARLNLQLIYGLPGDDAAGFRASLDYALSLEPDAVMTFPALALPGSELGKDPEGFGLERQEEPPYRVLRTRTFSPEELAEADYLAFLLFTVQRHRAASAVLRRLGRVVGHAAAYEAFGRAAAGTAYDLRPAYERARRDLLGFVTHSGEPWGDLPRAGREAGLLRLLAAFARGELSRAGRPEAWPGVAQALEDARAAALWGEVVSAPAFHRALDGALGRGTGPSLWLGLEESSVDEAPLLADGPRYHLLRDEPRPCEPCKAGRHLYPGDPPPEAAGLARAVVSRAAGLLAPAERAALWVALRRGARDGARLAVLDAAEGVDEGVLRAELEAARWRPVGRPSPLAGGAFLMRLAEAAP